MSKLRLLCIVVLSLAAGCSHPRHAEDPGTAPIATQTKSLTEAQVLEIARQAVAANDTWLDRAEFEKPRQQPDGSWHVMVWRLPKTPGGHRVIFIDAKGTVTSYMRGR